MQVSHAAREVAGEGVGGARGRGGERRDACAVRRPRPDADVTRDPPHCRPTELSPDTPVSHAQLRSGAHTTHYPLPSLNTSVKQLMCYYILINRLHDTVNTLKVKQLEILRALFLDLKQSFSFLSRPLQKLIWKTKLNKYYHKVS